MAESEEAKAAREALEDAKRRGDDELAAVLERVLGRFQEPQP